MANSFRELVSKGPMGCTTSFCVVCLIRSFKLFVGHFLIITPMVAYLLFLLLLKKKGLNLYHSVTNMIVPSSTKVVVSKLEKCG